MRIHVLLRAAAGVLAAALLLLAIPPSKSADLIILKDGFTLHANVIKKVKTEFEPETKQAITITQGYELEDGARRIRLSWNQVLDGKKQEQTDKADIVALEIKFRRRLSAPARPILQINEVTAWNDKLVREFKADTEQGPIKAEQQLGFFSSQFARVDALNYSWSAYYFTRELGLDTVQSLLRKHPQLNQKNGKPNALQRFRIYRFLVQAGWYDAAEKELDQFLKDFPDEKEKAESARENLRELRNQQWADAIEQGFRAGRHRWTQDQLAQFLDKSKDEKLLVRARALKAKYEKANEDLKQARRFLTELPEQLKVGAEKQLAEAAAALLAEIRLDHFLPPEPDQAKTDRFKFQRLEAFLGMARQAERARQKGTKAAQPGELLAYAVTGWFLGSNVAEGKMDSAIRLWQARRFVLQHQRTHSVEKREELVYAFQKDDLVPFDELAQLIGVLPPPEPEELMSSEKSNGLPAVLELATNLPWGRKKGVRYLVQLPPEYHHNRPYPVLFVLHHATNTARDMIGPWRGLA
ncbi:MAG TPA: hypothetical protein VKI65_09905, partial [Gemmataceae bacterium]|nr:hypothetical protein [Gemmataceae bacterium]